eukprot:GFKZ01004477.1.p1 GENE.GFKZ01004477.1~~GFKZ01004477.1.p1  ORF type:complete len:896 (+),score=134.07 GFKZ01004477.1:187-2874(+)
MPSSGEHSENSIPDISPSFGCLPPLTSQPKQRKTRSSFWKLVFKSGTPPPKTQKVGEWINDETTDDDHLQYLEKVVAEDTNTLPKANLPDSIDDRDKLTPDNWVKRSKALLRLTGKHPLNAEPSISTIYDEGFITPVSHHFVRNHGRTAKVNPATFTLVIDGLVDQELRLSLNDLKKFPNVTMPVTLCCSANRRKEFNTIAKTIGFNWTTAATSTSMWTGVRLADVLAKASVDMGKARYVHFEGVQSEDLPNGLYATSIDILTATNPFDHVLLAWNQNGVELHPDHGYPLRAIVPGFVGGRSVKWLQRVTVSATSSQNFYHFHDNRIMPPFVDAERATDEGWWFREEFIYNELNVNSIIVHPTHEQTVMLSSQNESITVKGFGLSGGGRKVTRVEMTLDNGKNWRLCNLRYPEEKYSAAPTYFRYYCWMFFEIKLSAKELVEIARSGGEIRSRAWDSSSNVQPLEHTWNVLGHGNNTQFRLKLEIAHKNGVEAIKFIHPVATADLKTGWMHTDKEEHVTREEEESIVETVSESSETGEDGMIFNEEEVAKHSSKDDCWIVVNGGVYDVSSYLIEHPGGAESILLNGGMDATEDFIAIHSEKAKKQLEDFRIGSLRKKNSTVAFAKPSPPLRNRNSLIALDPSKWVDFELIQRVDVNWNTRLYTFALQSPDHILGLPVGYHVFVKATVNDRKVIRAFTPVSSEKDKGRVVFCIKTYFANVNPRFPAGGKMSQYFEKLKIGDNIAIRGPLGHVEYNGPGNIIIHGEQRRVSSLGMICGGTGITPAFQIIKSIYDNPNDKTVIKLLYANNNEDDILMKDELLKMSERENIYVWFTVVNAGNEWTMSKGFVTREMIAKHIPPPSQETVIGLCGPPPMIKKACLPILEDLSHSTRNITIF